MTSKPKINLKTGFWTGLFVLLASVIILVLGFFFFRYGKSMIKKEKNTEFEAISRLKIEQIVQWQKERTGDAFLFSHLPFFDNLVDRWISKKDNQDLRNGIRERLLIPQQFYGYKNICISNIKGELVFSLNPEPDHFDEVTTEKIFEAFKTGKIICTDFYYCKEEKKIRYDFIAPLLNKEKHPIAALVFRIDPEDYLYRFIQFWPTPSSTVETNIVRKEKDSVVFLGKLRFLPNSALKVKLPLTQTERPAVLAALGYKGLWSGRDYRNKDVLAYLNSVPGTDWFLVIKIDKSEVYTDLYREDVFFILGLIVIILIIATGLDSLYNYRQKNIFMELWKSSEELSTTLHSIGDAVISTDKHGIIRYMNPVAEQLTGWRFNEGQGKKISEVFQIINEKTRRAIENPAEMVIREGTVVGLANHTLLISKDGKEISIADSGSPIKNQAGEIIGVVLVFKDQTKEAEAQQKLNVSETKYRRLFESAKDGILILDAGTGKIMDVNPYLIELLGYSKEQFLGKTIWEIGAFKDIIDNQDKFKELQLKGYVSYDDLPLETIGRQKIDVEFVSNTYLVNSHNVIQCNIRNISERRQLMRELIISKEKAEESDKLKSAFLANMSHEIRTPMNGILGFSELLKDPELTAELRQKYLQIIQKSGNRLLNIINDIVDIAKIEAGQMETTISETNVTEQAEFIYTFFQPEVNAKGVQIVLNNALQGSEATIYTDREKLYAIFTNLVKNAIKYTSEGFIEIGYEKQGRYLEFYVKDTGAGINQEQKEIIFERFRQGGSLDSRVHDGSGLGLSISKAYVESMGGKIWVQSETGKGSTFYFTIPYKPVVEPASVKKNVIPADQETHKVRDLKILVAEDDETSEIFLRAVIRKISNKVIYVTSGVKAIEECLKNPDLDLVLMDIRMPFMDGYETTRRIRQFNRDVVIIAQTAYALSGDREKALESGCDDYISKPLNHLLLLSLIQKHFNQGSPEQAG